MTASRGHPMTSAASISSRLPPSSGVGQPTIGRPFYGQAKGLLSPAGRLYGFPSGEARLSGFRRQRRHLYWRPKGRRTSPAQRYYIPSEGESPQPACKAKPITGRTIGAQGRQARRLPQPSPAGRQPSGIPVSTESLTKAHDLK